MFRSVIKGAIRRTGYEVRRISDAAPQFIPDEPKWIREVLDFVQPFTMTSPERIATLCHAVEYLDRNEINGDIVECGVWRGGSMMAAALTLGRSQHWRTLHLYGTFEGMSEPGLHDVEISTGRSAKEAMRSEGSAWCKSPLDEVRANLASTSYPLDRLKFIIGKVEDTIPSSSPERIALLRLDTDWYESTKHELIHLWPRLVRNGIMIIDDYGHWTGAKKAVDELIAAAGSPLFLNRIDYTGRLIVKP
jgi:hypothetical protein